MFNALRAPSERQVSAISGASMAYSQLVSALFGGFLSAYLGASDYGVLNLARTIFIVAVAVTPLGCDVALIRRLASADGEPERMAGEVNWLRAISIALAGVLAGACLAGGANTLEASVFRYPHFGWTLAVTALALPFASDMALLYGACRGLRQPLPSVIATYVLQPTVRMVLIAGLLLVVDRLPAAAVGTSVSYIVAGLFMMLVTRRVFPARTLRVSGAAAHARATLRFAPVLGAAMLAAIFTRALDVISLGYFATSGDVGRYSLVILVSQMVGVIGASIGQTMGSRVAETAHAGDHAGVAALVRENMSLGSILCAPFCIAVCLWGQDVDLVLGPTYVIPWPVFAMASVTQWVVITTNNSSYALSVTGRHNQELLNSLASLVVQAVACLVLTPALGMLGAAMATMLSTTAINALRQQQIRAMVQENVFGLRLLLPIVLAALVGVPLLGLEIWLGFRTWWLTAILASAHVALSFALVFAVAVAPESRRALIGTVLRR